jgi:hypothetical protein
MFGSAFVGVMDAFVQRYGTVATHDAVTRLPAQWRPLVQPHAPRLGILGAKKYPYPFINELVKAMAAAVRAPDEDAFIEMLGSYGVDATLDTVERFALRYLVSPQSVAAKSPEIWRMFHDCGTLTITSCTDREFLSEVSHWPQHDVIVCKLGVGGGRRIVERTGAKNVEARREKCRSWGHDVCLTRIRWG